MSPLSPLACVIAMACAVAVLLMGFWFGARYAYRKAMGRAMLSDYPAATRKTQRRCRRLDVRPALRRRPDLDTHRLHDLMMGGDDNG